MQPLAQEAAQVLIVRVVVRLLLCAPTFPGVFLNIPHCLCDTPPQDSVTWTDIL